MRTVKGDGCRIYVTEAAHPFVRLVAAPFNAHLRKIGHGTTRRPGKAGSICESRRDWPRFRTDAAP